VDQSGEIEVAPLSPGAIDQGREQDVLATAQGIRVHADESEQPRDGGERALAQRVGVGHDRRRGRREGAQHAERDARASARSVDGDVGGLAQARDTRAILPPSSEALAPGLGGGARVLVRGVALARRLCRVDPGTEVRRAQLGKVEQQIAQVALGIDGDGGDAIDGGLFEERDAQTRLATARHADANGMGGQVLRVVEGQLIAHPATSFS
jgi:hypothetical protein